MKLASLNARHPAIARPTRPADESTEWHEAIALVPLQPRWLDVQAAADYLCMSTDALYHRVQRRQIPFVRRGRIVRFDRLALDRWMDKGARHGFEEAR